jgi:hypothetical protein
MKGTILTVFLKLVCDKPNDLSDFVLPELILIFQAIHMQPAAS